MARGSSSSGGLDSSPSSAVEMIGESGQIDRTGKITVRKRYFVANQEDVSRVTPLDGYRATNITYNKIGGGVYEQNVEYTAQIDANQAPGIVETLRGLSGTFEMITGYEIVPIERHPRVDQLVNDYAGQFIDGLARWFNPTYIPATEDRSALAGGDFGLPNPMFGVTAYKDVTMTMRHTYHVRGVPRSIYDKAGLVVDTLPAGFPTPKGPVNKEGKEIKRKWMMQMPAVSRDGESYRVVQEYVLLDTSGITDGKMYIKTSTPGIGQA